MAHHTAHVLAICDQMYTDQLQQLIDTLNKDVEKRKAGAIAAAKVFGISELLETILFELPMRDLVLDQRVCKQWSALINSSRKIQRALFFEPVSTELLLLKEKNEEVEGYDPENLYWAFPGQGSKEVVPLRNPLLPQGLWTKPMILDGYSEAWRRSEASWRRMLMAQPPVNTRVRVSHIRGRSTINKLCDLVVTKLDQNRQGSFVERVRSTTQVLAGQGVRRLEYLYFGSEQWQLAFDNYDVEAMRKAQGE